VPWVLAVRLRNGAFDVTESRLDGDTIAACVVFLLSEFGAPTGRLLLQYYILIPQC
jgi:hypothetical protein